MPIDIPVDQEEDKSPCGRLPGPSNAPPRQIVHSNRRARGPLKKERRLDVPMKNSEARGRGEGQEEGRRWRDDPVVRGFSFRWRGLRHPGGAAAPTPGIPSRHYLIVSSETKQRWSRGLNLTFLPLSSVGYRVHTWSRNVWLDSMIPGWTNAGPETTAMIGSLGSWTDHP